MVLSSIVTIAGALEHRYLPGYGPGLLNTKR
jgi:hypothetical protein